jgi:hypothetical protein
MIKAAHSLAGLERRLKAAFRKVGHRYLHPLFDLSLRPGSFCP